MIASTIPLTKNFKALVLNASYEPLKVISWQKALLLWFQNKVEILEYHSSSVRSVSQSFQLPSVLRFKNYVRPKKNNAVRFCRDNVYIRDNYTCQYCAQTFITKELTIDHVLPASKGGQKTWNNIVSACRPCNQKKANRTPDKAMMPLLTKPKQPHWLPFVDVHLMGDQKDKLPLTWKDYLKLK